MADLGFQPVAGRVPVQPGMSLGEMLNLAQGVQQYQQAQQMNPLTLEAQRLAVQQATAVNPELLRQQQSQTRRLEQTEQPFIAQQAAATQAAQAQAQQAELATMRAYLSNVRSEALSLLKNPSITYDDIVNSFKASLDNTPASKELKDRVLSQGLAAIPKGLNSDQYRLMVGKELVKTLGAEGQINAMFPSVTMISTGEKAVPVTTGGALAVQTPGQPLPGGVEMGIPPTTEVVSPTGERRLLGPLSQRGGAQPPVTGLSPTQMAGLTGAGQVAVKDWETTYSEGREAAPRIATFQNIKKLVPEAFTGVGAEKKQFVTGLAQAVGIPLNVLEASSTEELAKNTKILQLAGGNTDAARSIAELANPNVKMTKEGILRVTNQLIGMEKLKQARSNYLQPFANDATTYQRKAAEFNQVADPRIFQEFTREEVAKMRQSMSESERREMTDRIRLAKQLGVI